MSPPRLSPRSDAVPQHSTPHHTLLLFVLLQEAFPQRVSQERTLIQINAKTEEVVEGYRGVTCLWTRVE